MSKYSAQQSQCAWQFFFSLCAIPVFLGIFVWSVVGDLRLYLSIPIATFSIMAIALAAMSAIGAFTEFGQLIRKDGGS